MKIKVLIKVGIKMVDQSVVTWNILLIILSDFPIGDDLTMDLLFVFLLL